MAGKRRGSGPAGRPVVSDESRGRHGAMLTLTEGQEEQVRGAAARNGEPPERLRARVVALGWAQLAAEAGQGPEPGPGDEGDGDAGNGYRPPFGAAAAAER